MCLTVVTCAAGGDEQGEELKCDSECDWGKEFVRDWE